MDEKRPTNTSPEAAAGPESESSPEPQTPSPPGEVALHSPPSGAAETESESSVEPQTPSPPGEAALYSPRGAQASDSNPLEPLTPSPRRTLRGEDPRGAARAETPVSSTPSSRSDSRGGARADSPRTPDSERRRLEATLFSSPGSDSGAEGYGSSDAEKDRVAPDEMVRLMRERHALETRRRELLKPGGPPKSEEVVQQELEHIKTQLTAIIERQRAGARSLESRVLKKERRTLRANLTSQEMRTMLSAQQRLKQLASGNRAQTQSGPRRNSIGENSTLQPPEEGGAHGHSRLRRQRHLSSLVGPASESPEPTRASPAIPAIEESSAPKEKGLPPAYVNPPSIDEISDLSGVPSDEDEMSEHSGATSDDDWTTVDDSDEEPPASPTP